MIREDLRILVVDDHDIVLRGLQNLIKEKLGPKCQVDGVRSAKEALSRLAAMPYDLCLLDVELPDSSGTDLLMHMRALSPDIKVIVNTIHEEIWIVKSYFDAEVSGMLFKDVLSTEIATAIKTVAAGETYFCRRALQLKSLISDLKVPTSKELEVLTFISSGLTTDEIASKMGLSFNTIETHRRHLLNKLHARNSAELVLNAVNYGIIPKSRM